MSTSSREARLAYMRQWCAEHREERRVKGKLYRAAHPELRERKREYDRTHRTEITARQRKWREANKEQVQAYFARYRQEHKDHKREIDNASREMRRACRYGAPTEHISLKVLRQRDRNICQICRQPVGDTGGSIDHIIPISYGGSHTWENVQLAHTVCNSRRGAGRIPAQMRLGGMASTCKAGPPGHRKLSEETVLRIRNGGERARDLRKELGLGQRTVYDIRQRKTWAWLA